MQLPTEDRTTRQPTPPSRREEILAAAAALFAERGFRGVTLKEIGAIVGMSGPGIYRHFASKEAVLAQLLIEVSEELFTTATARIGPSRQPAEALAALIQLHVDFSLTHPQLITVQARDLASLAPADQARVRRLQRAYLEVWVEAIIAGAPTLTRELAVAAAHGLFGLLNSTPHAPRLDREALRALLVSMAESALTAHAHGALIGAGQR